MMLGSSQFSSVAQSLSFDSLPPHGLQHARLPCPSPTPGACSNSCPSSQWCHPTIPSSVIPLRVFPSIRVFSNKSVLHIRWPSMGASASASVLPMSIQNWFPLGWTGWISFQSKGLSSLLQHQSSKASSLLSSALWSNSHLYMTGKAIALTRWTFVGKLRSLLFSMLPRFAIVFLPRSKHLLISWL